MSHSPTQIGNPDTASRSRPTAWAISSGARGMENQCIALAEAAGFAPVAFRVEAKAPWRWLPERAWPLWHQPLGIAAALSAENRKMLNGPWPDLAIACGRQSVPLAIHLRNASRGRTFVAQCQNPRVPAHLFDLVVPPEHDRMDEAANIFPIAGSPNLALPWRLAKAAEQWRPTFAPLGSPLIAIAIGGSSSRYTMTAQNIDAMFSTLEQMQTANDARLAITTSRRTGAANHALITAHARRLNAWLWDGVGDSPIWGMYALADAIVVTEDSVNMAAEAAATGKPVYVAGLDGGSQKFDQFHKALRDAHITRRLALPFEHWSYTPLAETQRAAQRLRTMMAERHFALPDLPA